MSLCATFSLQSRRLERCCREEANGERRTERDTGLAVAGPRVGHGGMGSCDQREGEDADRQAPSGRSTEAETSEGSEADIATPHIGVLPTERDDPEGDHGNNYADG